MSELTRRDFLKYCGAGAVTVAIAAALAGCSSSDEAESSTESSTSTTTETTTSTSDETSPDTTTDTEMEETSGPAGADYWPGIYELDTVAVAGSRDNGSFYPGGANKIGSVQPNIFQYLALKGDSGETKLVLLKSIEQVSDTVYACEMWDFIYDTNGVNMKASDVDYSFTRYADVDGFSGAFNKLDHIEPTGDYTFNWICKEPFNLGELIKNFSSMPIFTQESFESTGTDEMVTTPIGSGPYMLSSYTTGSRVELTANEDFWMKNITDSEWIEENYYMSDAQKVKDITVDIVAEASSRAIALEMGTIIAVDSLNVLDAMQYLNDESFGIDVIMIHELGAIGITFNCTEDSPCSDLNFRKAVCYLIDNVAYADGCSYPSEPCYGFLPRFYDALPEWNDPSNDYFNYDLEKAKELFAESNYSSEYDNKELVFLYNSSSVAILGDVAIMLQASLKEVGIQSSLLPADMAVISTYSNDYTMWDISIGSYGSDGSGYVYGPAINYNTASSSNGLQGTGLADYYLDELSDAVAAAGAGEEASDAIREFDQYLSYEKVYQHSILCYDSCAGCLSEYNSAMSAGGQLVPGAITKK